MTSKLVYLIAFAVFTLGMFMRITMVSTTTMDNPIRADALEYYTYAYNLKEFDVFSGKPIPLTLESRNPPEPDAGRSPGYPLFILPFVTYPPTIDMMHSITIAQAILSSLLIALVFIVAYRHIHPVAAVLCALFVAISPQLIIADYYLLTESVFTFMLLVAVASFSFAGSTGYRFWMLTSGIALGIAALIKPTMIYSPPFVLIASWLIFRRSGTVLVRSLLIALGFAVIYGPWYARNLGNEENQGPGQKSQATLAVHNGMYPGLMFDGEPASRGAQHRWDPEYNNYSNLGEVLQLLRSKFEKDPATYIQWYLIGKPLTFFDKDLVNGDGGLFIYPVTSSPYHTNDLFFTTYRIMQFLHWGFIATALATAVLVWLPVFESGMSSGAVILGRFISIIFLYFLLVHIAGNPLPRYSIPLRPEIYIMTLLGSTWLFTSLRTMKLHNRGHYPGQVS
jgi:4-amino-4-deoxy-L-arabinose transferase-like glycosyltransferase